MSRPKQPRLPIVRHLIERSDLEEKYKKIFLNGRVISSQIDHLHINYYVNMISLAVEQDIYHAETTDREGVAWHLIINVVAE